MDSTGNRGSREIEYLLIKSDIGAGAPGAALGPDAVRMAALEEGDARLYGPRVRNLSLLDAEQPPHPPAPRHPHARSIERIAPFYREAAAEMAGIIRAGRFPMIFSGDHGNAAATLAGLKQARPDDRLGVIWIDAHLDMHTPWTTPSGNMHGMPLAAALGEGPCADCPNQPGPEVERLWGEICALGGKPPILSPKDLVMIGIRDYEAEEAQLARSRDVLVIEPETIAQDGPEVIAGRALERLEDCDMIYVSFDVDSLDRCYLIGTGTPVYGGLIVAQARAMLRAFWACPRLAALEFTEVNPLLDVHNQAAHIAYYLARQFLQAA